MPLENVLLKLTANAMAARKRLGGSKKGTVSRRPRLNSVIRGDVCLSRSLPSLQVPATVAAYSLPLLPSLSESFFSISSSPVPVFSPPFSCSVKVSSTSELHRALAALRLLPPNDSNHGSEYGVAFKFDFPTYSLEPGIRFVIQISGHSWPPSAAKMGFHL